MPDDLNDEDLFSDKRDPFVAAAVPMFLLPLGGFTLGFAGGLLVVFAMSGFDPFGAAEDSIEELQTEERWAALARHTEGCLETYAASRGFGYDDDPTGWGQDPKTVEATCRTMGGACDAATFITREAARCIFEAKGRMSVEALALEWDLDWQEEYHWKGEACRAEGGTLELGYEPRYGRHGAARWRYTPPPQADGPCSDAVFADLDAATGHPLMWLNEGGLSLFERERRWHDDRASEVRWCVDRHPTEPEGKNNDAVIARACTDAGVTCERGAVMTKAAAACIVEYRNVSKSDACDRSEWIYELKGVPAADGEGLVVWQVTPHPREYSPRPSPRDHTQYRCDNGMITMKLDAQTGVVVQRREREELRGKQLRRFDRQYYNPEEP